MDLAHLRRIRALQERLSANGIDAGLIQQPRDLFYYIGVTHPCNLWVPKQGEPLLFSRRVHARLREKAPPGLEVLQAAGYGEMLEHLAGRGQLPAGGSASGLTIGLELDVVPAGMVESLRARLGGARVANVSPLILEQRAVKEPSEVEAIRQALGLWREGHEAVLEALAPGVAEYELACAFEAAVRQAGGEGHLWFRRWDAVLPGGGIVASGPNGWVVSGHAMTVTGVGLGPALPWGASQRVVKAGELVVVDYGVCLQGYHADLCRTYCLGEPSPEQADLWRRLLEIHEAAIEAVRPGVTAEEVYEAALARACRLGMEEHFMGVGADRGTYIGHGIGLEMDEAPLLAKGVRTVLEPGMVVTVEPKLMVPGLGGVMVEDDLVVTAAGREVLQGVAPHLFCT